MTSASRAALLLLIAGALGGISLAVNPAARALLKNEVASDEIPAAAASWLGAKAMWIDARSEAAFDEGHVDGAILLNEDEWSTLLPRVIAEWKPGTTVIVYCEPGGCQAGRTVADRLRSESGIESIKVLQGDWRTVKVRK